MKYKEILKQLDLKKIQEEITAEFIDVRIEEVSEDKIIIKNRELINATTKPSVGAFIRVLLNGNWIYLSTTNLDGLSNEIYSLVKRVPDLNTNTTSPIFPCFSGKHHLIKNEKNAFCKVSLATKVDLLNHYLPIIDMISHLQDYRLVFKDCYKIKLYKSTVGTEFEYDFNGASFAISATLKDGSDLFTDFFQRYGTSFETFSNLEKEISDFFKESVKFIHAKTVTPGKYRLLLSPETIGVFTHESFGHKSEADFIVGDEEARNQWKLGQKVGAECLSILDSGLYEESSGYCPIDDEGSIAQKNYLIKNGILAGRLHSTQTAAILNEPHTGNARAVSFEYEPIVRMTATYIENGKTPKEELFQLCKEGLYIDGYNHGSGGSTFTIAPNRVYEIKNGKLGEPRRAAVITGSIFTTLNNIIAVGDDFRLGSNILGGCGKIEQWPLTVAHGGPTVLISEMSVS